MSDRSAAVEFRDEKAAAATVRLLEHGDNVITIDQKLTAKHVPARTLATEKNAKRKDDGPLEIVCKWIVEYQVGTSMPPSLEMPAVTDEQPQASRSTC
jgi:acyl-CoA-dependent ceramide synthase